jgi:hypothetical protein
MTVPISFHSAPVIQQSVVPPQQNTSDDEFGTGIQQQQKVPPDPSSLFSVSGPDSTTSSLIYTTSTVPSNTTSLLAPIPQMPQAYFATPMGVVMTAPPPQAFDQVPATVPAPYPTPLTHPAVLSPLPHQVFQTTATTTPFVALFDDSNLRLREHVRIQM